MKRHLKTMLYSLVIVAGISFTQVMVDKNIDGIPYWIVNIPITVLLYGVVYLALGGTKPPKEDAT